MNNTMKLQPVARDGWLAECHNSLGVLTSTIRASFPNAKEVGVVFTAVPVPTVSNRAQREVLEIYIDFKDQSDRTQAKALLDSNAIPGLRDVTVAVSQKVGAGSYSRRLLVRPKDIHS